MAHGGGSALLPCHPCSRVLAQLPPNRVETTADGALVWRIAILRAAGKPFLKLADKLCLGFRQTMLVNAFDDSHVHRVPIVLRGALGAGWPADHFVLLLDTRDFGGADQNIGLGDHEASGWFGDEFPF